MAEVTVSPRYLNFRNVNRDALPKPLRLTIRLKPGRHLKIKRVWTESKAIVLRREETSETGAVYAVSLAEDVPTGRVTGRIEITTNSRKLPKVEVPFYAFVQGNVKVSPQLVSFGMIRPGHPATREVTLKRVGKRAFSVKRVESSTPSLTTKILPVQEGESYRIRVTYDPGEKKRGRVSEMLTVTLGGEVEEILQVPVYGTIHEVLDKNAPPSARRP